MILPVLLSKHASSDAYDLCLYALYFTVLFTKNKRENLTILPNKKNSAGKFPQNFPHVQNVIVGAPTLSSHLLQWPDGGYQYTGSSAYV